MNIFDIIPTLKRHVNSVRANLRIIKEFYNFYEPQPATIFYDWGSDLHHVIPRLLPLVGFNPFSASPEGPEYAYEPHWWPLHGRPSAVYMETRIWRSHNIVANIDRVYQGIRSQERLAREYPPTNAKRIRDERRIATSLLEAVGYILSVQENEPILQKMKHHIAALRLQICEAGQGHHLRSLGSCDLRCLDIEPA